MEEVLKQDKGKSHKEFEKLLSEDLSNRSFRENEIVTGTVEEIGKKWVYISVGLKSSGRVSLEEYKLTNELDSLKIGDHTEVLLERLEDRNGEMVISREKARMTKNWNKLKISFFV